MGETKNVKIYLDTETIYYNEALNAYKVYTRTQRSDTSYQIHLDYYYCDSRVATRIYYALMDKSDGIIADGYENETYEIIPESNPEKVFNYLCK